MPLVSFICPDKQQIKVCDCLKEGGCRMGTRCATRSYLKYVAADRPWTGKPSTTQLIKGTMAAFLAITKDYAISPDARAFTVHGTRAHKNLEDSEDECSEIEVKFRAGDISGMADDIETENGKTALIDYKTSGSFKVAKALGFTIVKEPSDEVYKKGPKKGQQKTRDILVRREDAIDRWEWELQLNFYRLLAIKEKITDHIDELRIQCVVRDGNTWIAKSRGVFRNVYYFKINILPDEFIEKYFEIKRLAMEKALKQGYWDEVCNDKETWSGLKCAKYCEVAEFCKLGKYLKREKEEEDMAIKGLSEIRRLPRLGKIRLGITKVTAGGKEYPAEVDYFILDPQTPSELENKKLVDEFHKLYGDQPKSIKIMFPLADEEKIFPQFYKRYGSSTSLQCKGDGEIAYCAAEEFAGGLTKLPYAKDEVPAGIRVRCDGQKCPYYTSKKCTESATLQILLPDLPGAGVWQINTGSYHSIVNINSCLDYIRAVCGRFSMIPLTLERRETETQYKDAAGKVIKGKHYILHINMDFKLANLQKLAQIEPTKALLELPAPEEDKKDLLFKENAVIDAEPIPDDIKPIVPQEAAKDTNGKVGYSEEGFLQIVTEIEAIATREQYEVAAKKYADLEPTTEHEQAELIKCYLDTAAKKVGAKAPAPTPDNYGDLKRFGLNTANAEGMIRNIKTARAKLGSAEYMKVLGAEGWESVALIPDIMTLGKVTNALMKAAKAREE